MSNDFNFPEYDAREGKFNEREGKGVHHVHATKGASGGAKDGGRKKNKAGSKLRGPGKGEGGTKGVAGSGSGKGGTAGKAGSGTGKVQNPSGKAPSKQEQKKKKK